MQTAVDVGARIKVVCLCECIGVHLSSFTKSFSVLRALVTSAVGMSVLASAKLQFAHNQ